MDRAGTRPRQHRTGHAGGPPRDQPRRRVGPPAELRPPAFVRALVQRVSRASVAVDGDTVGVIGRGLCVFVGVTHGDTPATARALAAKVWHLRVFDDDNGVMNRSLADTAGAALVVSQFTL